MPRPIALALALLALAGPALAQQAESPPAKPRAKSPARRPRRDPPGTYMGRAIAPTMSWTEIPWLFRPEREQEERPDAMLDALQIQPGQTVADVGAGAGYTSLKLSKRVGPEGTVLATDLQPEMIRALRANTRAAGASNIKPILCTPTDTRLPAGAVDLILMVDVYHECSNPEATLKGLRAALKPGGRLVLVEFRAEDPDVPIRPEHKLTIAQARREVEPQGFKFKESLDFLPWQHILIFEKPADDPVPAEPKSAPRR